MYCSSCNKYSISNLQMWKELASFKTRVSGSNSHCNIHVLTFCYSLSHIIWMYLCYLTRSWWIKGSFGADESSFSLPSHSATYLINKILVDCCIFASPTGRCMITPPDLTWPPVGSTILIPAYVQFSPSDQPEGRMPQTERPRNAVTHDTDV